VTTVGKPGVQVASITKRPMPHLQGGRGPVGGRGADKREIRHTRGAREAPKVRIGSGRQAFRRAVPRNGLHPLGGQERSDVGAVIQAAWTNCICVPASSITSPIFRLIVSPVSGVLLTVGRDAPSTWAST
jgi:hypothetical protein